MEQIFSDHETENLRELWEALLLSNRINVCTEKLKNLNLIDVNILKLLTNFPEIKLKDVAHRMNIPNSTLTHAVTRLEKRNLVKRVISSKDLRSFKLEITPDGNQAITEHRNGEQRVFQELLGSLSAQEIKQFVSLFEKIVKGYLEV